MESRRLRGEITLRFQDVREQFHRVVDGGDRGVGLEDGVVEFEIERDSRSGGDRIEEGFGVR